MNVSNVAMAVCVVLMLLNVGWYIGGLVRGVDGSAAVREATMWGVFALVVKVILS